MITKSKITKLYPNTREEVITNMLVIYRYLEEKYGEVKDEWKTILSLLATDLELKFQCLETIKTDGISVKDRYGGTTKNSLFAVMNSLDIQIMKCVNELGLSPKSAAKIKDSDDDTSTEETAIDFINNLTQ